MAANNTLIISGIKSSDLIIGQHITFIVTLSSSENIAMKKKVTIKEGHSENIKFDHDSVDLSYEPGNHTATATFGFKILPNAINNPNISFEVDTNATAGGVNFHSKSFSDKAKTAIVDIKKPMDISINKNADLVIGQHVSFTVTLSSDKPISLAANITISNKSPNIQFDQPSANLGYDPTFKHASAKLGFTVLEGTTDNSEIKFNVDTTATSGGAAFSSVLFQGTANEIDKKSLSLFITNPVLKTVLPEGGPISETNNFTPITATLKSTSGKSLAYTPVFITSTVSHKMTDFKFKKADETTNINLEKIGPSEGLMLTSDSTGLVKFYLYPKLSEIAILTLRTIILNDVADVLAKQIIYAVNYKDPGYMDSIGYPTIDGFTMGDLSADQGIREFYTMVSSYDQAAVNDAILFFVDGEYTGHSVHLHNLSEQLDQYNIPLPYSIFKENKSSQFSYAAVKTSGDIFYSEVLTLNYIGGIPYEPDPGVKRKFNPCIVHTSLGVGPDNIIPSGMGNYINYGAIMKYPGYPHRGIFIEIVRSDPKFINLPEGTKAVPLDIKDITLIMYINSDGNSFQKPYTQQIKLADIGGPGNKNSIFFHIPYNDIVNIHGNGYIYFDYQFYQDDKLEHGAIWNSSIETVPVPGE
ncbi:hypothetical protein Xsto_00238 [Xenorhabdus stockiae]|uniref:Uncharacterized protein n=1 Tax=Xenorhabdus stockiae TaxID=351614 RepID=A0A2D0KWI9_9GAMM|nr:hypothetical protein [Xenorhabdus stockiae]PHM67675.1 hypothetical protein Xsto_00238 [Xenorhabdus stockiae]